MSFATINGLNVYRLVAHLNSNTYSVENGEKTPLTFEPLLTIDEAIDFIYKHNVSLGNIECRYVLVESKE